MRLWTKKENKFDIHWSKRNIFLALEFKIFRFFDKRAHRRFLEEWTDYTSKIEDWCWK